MNLSNEELQILNSFSQSFLEYSQKSTTMVKRNVENAVNFLNNKLNAMISNTKELDSTQSKFLTNVLVYLDGLQKQREKLYQKPDVDQVLLKSINDGIDKLNTAIDRVRFLSPKKINQIVDDYYKNYNKNSSETRNFKQVSNESESGNKEIKGYFENINNNIGNMNKEIMKIEKNFSDFFKEMENNMKNLSENSVLTRRFVESKKNLLKNNDKNKEKSEKTDEKNNKKHEKAKEIQKKIDKGLQNTLKENRFLNKKNKIVTKKNDFSNKNVKNIKNLNKKMGKLVQMQDSILQDLKSTSNNKRNFFRFKDVFQIENNESKENCLKNDNEMIVLLEENRKKLEKLIFSLKNKINSKEFSSLQREFGEIVSEFEKKKTIENCLLKKELAGYLIEMKEKINSSIKKINHGNIKENNMKNLYFVINQTQKFVELFEKKKQISNRVQAISKGLVKEIEEFEKKFVRFKVFNCFREEFEEMKRDLCRLCQKTKGKLHRRLR